jgi:hypothetical protein
MTLHLDAGAEYEVPAEQRLNQPVRAAVAAAEVLLAAALVLVAVWAWGNATIPVPLPPPDNPAIPQATSSTDGRWIAGAVGSVVAAGLLVLDAVRQTLLAVRTGGWR